MDQLAEELKQSSPSSANTETKPVDVEDLFRRWQEGVELTDEELELIDNHLGGSIEPGY